MPHGGVTVRNRLAEVLEELVSRPKHIAVGVLGERAASLHDGAGKDVTVGDVAHWNYYGTTTISARPFIAIAFERHRDEIEKVLARATRGVLEEKLSAERALELVGEFAVGLVKQAIADGIPPPNAQSTIEQKGSSTPLIGVTGQLRGSVTSQVRDGRSG